jgi:hypothetical protein
MSDILSSDEFLKSEYAESFYVVDGSSLSQCVSTFCRPYKGDDYKLNFMGDASINDIPRSEWDEELEERFEDAKSFLYKYCKFSCDFDGKKIVPVYDEEDQMVRVRYA